MADATPSRRWFQFHLSTIVALSLTAAWLMFWNFVPRNVSGAYGWPFSHAWHDANLDTANGLSALLVLYLVFKLFNRLNSPAGQQRLKELKARLRRTRLVTRVATAISTAAVGYLGYANGVREGAWVNYGWPAHAVRIYQLQRSYSWGFIANEYAYGDLALDLLISASIVSLTFVLCEWGNDEA